MLTNLSKNLRRIRMNDTVETKKGDKKELPFDQKIRLSQLHPDITDIVSNAKNKNGTSGVYSSDKGKVVFLPLSHKMNDKIYILDTNTHVVFNDMDNTFTQAPDIEFKDIGGGLKKVIMKKTNGEELTSKTIKFSADLKTITFVQINQNKLVIRKEYKVLENSRIEAVKDFTKRLPYNQSASLKENVQFYIDHYNYKSNIVELNLADGRTYENKKNENNIYLLKADEVKKSCNLNDVKGRNVIILQARKDDYIIMNYDRQGRPILTVNGNNINLQCRVTLKAVLVLTDNGTLLKLWSKRNVRSSRFTLMRNGVNDLKRILTGVSNYQPLDRTKKRGDHNSELNNRRNDRRTISRQNEVVQFKNNSKIFAGADIATQNELLISNNKVDKVIATRDGQTLNATGGNDIYKINKDLRNVYITDTEGKNTIYIEYDAIPVQVDFHKGPGKTARITFKNQPDKVIVRFKDYDSVGKIYTISPNEKFKDEVKLSMGVKTNLKRAGLDSGSQNDALALAKTTMGAFKY